MSAKQFGMSSEKNQSFYPKAKRAGANVIKLFVRNLQIFILRYSVSWMRLEMLSKDNQFGFLQKLINHR
jgi:hypothetical protein